MYLITENYCVGGAEEDYELDADATLSMLRDAMLGGDYDSDDREKIRSANLDGLLAMGAPAHGGSVQIDVTRRGCRDSDIRVTEVVLAYTKDCPDDFLPGTVLRHTVDGNQDAVGDNHPDDLVPCPTCKGKGRVPMEPSDFTDWGHRIPPGVVSTPQN